MKITLKQEAPKPELKPTPKALTKDALDSVWGEINRYNIKTMPDAKQYVVHCVTNEIMERKDAQPLQDRRGNVMWIRIGEVLSPLDRPILQQWKNPERMVV